MVPAVAGATTSKSAQSAWLTCSVLDSFRAENKPEYKGFPLKVSNVSGVTNSKAAGVQTHFTSAPALTRSRIRLSVL